MCFSTTMNFIKKIIDKNIDASVHLQFQKFSKGEFANRALVRVKKTKDKFTITTSAEFSNELVSMMAQTLGERQTHVSGAIVSTHDLSGKIEFKDKKQFQGVKRYLIDSEMSGKDILRVIDEFPKVFFALSFSVGEGVLKIKPKAPKSGKPGSKGEEAPKADFCRLVTKNKEIAKSFVFEIDDFKEAQIKHDFVISEIVIPVELKDSKDFAQIREESKRKGIIKRVSVIDEKEYKQDINFEV